MSGERLRGERTQQFLTQRILWPFDIDKNIKTPSALGDTSVYYTLLSSLVTERECVQILAPKHHRSEKRPPKGGIKESWEKKAKQQSGGVPKDALHAP